MRVRSAIWCGSSSSSRSSAWPSRGRSASSPNRDGSPERTPRSCDAGETKKIELRYSAPACPVACRVRARMKVGFAIRSCRSHTRGRARGRDRRVTRRAALPRVRPRGLDDDALPPLHDSEAQRRRAGDQRAMQRLKHWQHGFSSTFSNRSRLPSRRTVRTRPFDVTNAVGHSALPS